MRSFRILSAPVLCGLLCGFGLLSAAQQTPPTPGVIRINVNLVQVDAVVTDSDGRPVTNLKAEDFELSQDGTPQKITNFEFIRVRDPLRALDPAAIPLPPGRGAPPPPETALRPETIRRTIALVVDDLALSADSIIRIRESLKRWVDHEMQPGDLVAVVRTNAGVGALQQFTNDKRMLYSAIDQIRYQPGRVGFMSISPLAPESPVDTALFDDEVEHAYLRISLNAIQFVIRGLRDLPGRKSLVLFSESMRLTFLEPGMVATTATTDVTREDRLRRLADEANRSSVVIYSIDPRGPMYTGLSASDGAAGRTSEQLSEVAGQRTQQLIESQDGMVVLAQKTGGLFYTSNDIASNIRRAVDDGNGYYLLGYQPEEATFDEKTGRSKFHSISLKVKRPGLTVRSRTGFFGTPDNRLAPPPQTRAAQLARALVSPFTTGDLGVRLTTLVSYSERQEAFIKVLLNFETKDLMFTDEPDGSKSAEIDIAIITSDVNGQITPNVDKTWRLSYSKQAFEEVLRRGLVYSVAVPMKKPGPYQVRVALRDGKAGKLGNASQFVEVPDVKNGRIALSGIVMTAAKVPGAPVTGREDIDGTPSVRIFKSGSAISYAFEILNARTDGKSPLQSQIRIFRDGQAVYSSTPAAIKADAKPGDRRLAVGGQLALNRISAGNYVMQIVVSDPQRGEKNGTATQAMDFQIQD